MAGNTNDREDSEIIELSQETKIRFEEGEASPIEPPLLGVARGPGNPFEKINLTIPDSGYNVPQSSEFFPVVIGKKDGNKMRGLFVGGNNIWIEIDSSGANQRIRVSEISSIRFEE